MELIEFTRKYSNILWSPATVTNKIETLYPYQEKFLKSLVEHRFTLSTSSRQMGLTNMLSLYCAWSLLYGKGVIAYMTLMYDQADRFIALVQDILDVAIKDTTLKQTTNNKREKVLSNKNKIIGRGISVCAIRGQNINQFIIDQAAFIDGLEDVFGAFAASLMPQGSMHLLSTANDFGFYNKLREDTDNSFYKMEFHYSLNPNFDEIWVSKMKQHLGETNWLSEMEMKPISKKTFYKNPEIR